MITEWGSMPKISDDHMQAALAEVDAYFASERLAKAAPRMLELLRGLVSVDPVRSFAFRGARRIEKGCYSCRKQALVGVSGRWECPFHAPGCPYAAAKAFLAEMEAGR